MAEEGGGEEATTAAVGAGDMEGQIVVAGAAYEEVMDGGWGGGGDQFIPPPGFRFRPSDDELVRYYLLPKLQGRAYVPNRAIIEANVYQCHPDQLIGKYRDRGEGNSYYFLSPRERRYDNGLRPRRDTKDGRGRWKVSTGKKDKGGDSDKEKKVAGDGMTQYCASVLNYFEGPKCKSDWLMRELTVPGYEIKLPKDGGPGGKTLDRYVMCKIYLKDDKGDDDEEAGPSSASPLHGPVEGGEGATAAELPKLSKKLAVKRPAEDQQLRNAAAAKKRAHHHSKCLQIEPPAPQGNGMQAPFSTPECYGGSGQPMGYHAGAAPMPRPLLAYNNGQVHVPRQQGACNGQVLVMTRQPAAYNGQVPVMTRQPAAYSGQMPARQQQVAFNGQVRPPAYRAAGSPSSYGQNLTMMMQPSCPAGQAVNPQMQKQPETDEILEKRVLRQNLEEYLRMQSEIQQRQMGFTQQQQQQQAMTLTQQQQQQQAMALTQQQQTMPLTQQQQQYAMALTQQQQQQQKAMALTQQQQKAMALTQQQQQKAMALMHRQQQAMAFMMRQQQQRRMSFMMHQQQQQYSGGANANNYHHAGAMVLPTTSSSPGEAVPVTADGSPVSTVESVEGNEEGNNGDCSNHGREEPAVVKVSPGGATASASASAEGDGPRRA